MERYKHTDRQSDMVFFSAYAIFSIALRARNKKKRNVHNLSGGLDSGLPIFKFPSGHVYDEGNHT